MIKSGPPSSPLGLAFHWAIPLLPTMPGTLAEVDRGRDWKTLLA
jgi:hypothetical protein